MKTMRLRGKVGVLQHPHPLRSKTRTWHALLCTLVWVLSLQAHADEVLLGEQPPPHVQEWFTKIEKLSAEDARIDSWTSGGCGPARNRFDKEPSHAAMDEIYKWCFPSSQGDRKQRGDSRHSSAITE